MRWLNLSPGDRVLDVGCGPGRHAIELAQRGVIVHGIDISDRFIEIARQNAPRGATFERGDARSLPFDSEFDAVICLCQGAFGLMTANGDDYKVLAGMSRALKPGGRLALSAFNAYFSVKYHEQATFEAGSGVAHEITEVKDESGVSKQVDLWTGCYTPRELRLMCANAGLTVSHLFSVDPGDYRDDPPSVESSEFMVIAFSRPS